MHPARPHDATLPPGPRGTPGPCTQATRTQVLESTSLLAGQREIRIRHGNQTYRLRHTRNDKLILTK